MPDRRIYKILRKQYKSLQTKALNAQKRDQTEVCGLLIEKGERLELLPMQNQSPDALRFEISLSDIRAVRKKLRGTGSKLVGTFHSHPISYAVPSKGDLKDASLNSLLLIYDVCGCEARLWKVSGSKRRKVPMPREFKLI